MDYIIGNNIKGYELLELIGTGGFGAVYRAHQTVVGREVAMKVILPEHANAPMFVRRFETEAQLVARLEHPYIVPLYDYWRDPSGAYLVMRYLRGGSLARLIKTEGPLNLEHSGKMLNQIAAALTVAHSNGVIHRDLKPDNILLDNEGNYFLSDFGIAKDMGTDVNLTQTGTIIGSPAYLSPEQITGEALTASSDVYTLGILLHYALTGEHPFPGKTPTAMLVHQMQDPMPPVQMRRDDISDDLEEVLQKATAKDPGSRYESVMNLAIAYNRAMQDVAGSTSGFQRAASADALISGMNTDTPNPYKGLKAFEEADASDFYGRDALTETLLDQLLPQGDHEEGDHLLVLVGPSGSGKSSVVKAGLLPALRQGAIPSSEDWFYADMVPGAHPMEEMEAALLRVAVNPPESLLRQLQETERGLLRAVKRVLPDDTGQLVLFIDQFEEVFTLTESEEERQHFLNSLLSVMAEPRNRLRLIITLRADFYDRPLSYHAFGELVRNHTQVVLPLSPQELEAAIVQPARQAGVTLEPGLSSAIVADVRDQPGALPLLQYALTQLYDQRDGARLTLEAYKRIGGAMGALAQRAETIYQGLPTEQQALTQQIFLRLVTLGEGAEDTRRRVARTELRSLGDDDMMENIITTFGRQRLLTFDNDPQTREPTLEVAHEALIREWRRLRDWLDNAREDLRTQRRLFQVAREWRNSNSDASYLARGTRLGQFEVLAQSANVAMNENELAYLQASLAARQEQQEREEARAAREQELEDAARQRLQLLFVIASVAAVVAIVLALLAFRSQRSAVLAREDAEAAAALAQENTERAEVVALSANALTLVDNFRPTLALNLALEAATRRPDVIAAQRALATAAYAPSAVGQLNPFPDVSLMATDFNQDGSQVVAGAANGRLLVIDTASYEVLTEIEAHTDENGDGLPVYAVAYSPSGGSVASGDGNGVIRLWDAQNGTRSLEIDAHTANVTALRFGPRGQQLLSAGMDGRVYLWDATTGEQLREFSGHVGAVFAADWAADAETIITSTGDDPTDPANIDRRVRVFDVTTGELLTDFAAEGTGWLRAVAITDDGRLAAAASYDPNAYGGTIRVIDTATGEVVRSLYGHTDVITTLDIAQNGETLLSGGWDKTMRHWNLTTGALIQRFDTHTDRVLAVRFAPHGNYALSTAGRDSGTPDDARALYYQLGSLALEHTLTGHTNWLWSVAYHPTGRLLATGSGDLNTAEGDNTIRLWDTTTGQQVAQLDGHTNTVNGVDFHADGALLASASQDGTVRLWEMRGMENARPLEVLRDTSDPDGPAALNDVDFGPDSNMLLTAGSDGTLRVWDLTSGEQLQVIEAHAGRVLRAKFSPSGERIASSGTDSQVRVWDAASGEQLHEFSGHTGWVSTVNFSPDGRYVLSGADNDLIIWDMEAPADDPIERVLVGHDGFVYGGDFSPDGQYVLSGASDTIVRLWSVETGEEIRQFNDHTNWILDVEFSPEGTSAVTVAEDNTARIWRIARSTEELAGWAQANRYLPDLTCAQRERYNVEPLCDVLDGGGEGRGREDRSEAEDEG